MIKIIVSIAAVSIAAILIYAATRPDSFRVERSTNIKSKAENIFPLINDFHAWKAWSPWEKVDPAATATFSGADSGVGAVYEWRGNKEVGEGRMEIIESSPPSKIVIKIEFIKPFAGQNTIEFILTPEGETTTVSQAMYGTSPFLSKLMCLFFNMDKMVGGKYEEGLAALKALAEKSGG